MPNSTIGLLAGIVLLAVAFPVAARVRHPNQKPVAAYLIFITVLSTVTIVLFTFFTWISAVLDLGLDPSTRGGSITLLALALVPAVILAIWQTRKPPIRRGPPS